MGLVELATYDMIMKGAGKQRQARVASHNFNFKGKEYFWGKEQYFRRSYTYVLCIS